jgi:DNA primase large subunit
MLNSIADMAKYPFTIEAANHVKKLDLKIDALADPVYRDVLSRAEQRVEEAVQDGVIKWIEKPPYEIEILSYPVAIMLVASIKDSYVWRRYSLAEAKKTYNLLKEEEDKGKLVEIAKSFNWKATEIPPETSQPYEYSISFINYLANAPVFHDKKYKLVNKLVVNGNVFLKKDEFSRLISEEAQKRIYQIIKSSPKLPVTSLRFQRLENIKRIIETEKRRHWREEIPTETLAEAYPPCIKRLYASLIASQHLSHFGRFTLTSFLLNVGVDMEKLVKTYISVSDFDENLTRYQIEHIAGKKGSSTRYNPPNCNTLKTHGLCPGPDELCKSIMHPRSYYQKKIRSVKGGYRAARKERRRLD